jgi:hypothetical protein
MMVSFRNLLSQCESTFARCKRTEQAATLAHTRQTEARFGTWHDAIPASPDLLGRCRSLPALIATCDTPYSRSNAATLLRSQRRSSASARPLVDDEAQRRKQSTGRPACT